MCTSLTLRTSDNKNIFARNMDFSISLNEQVHFIPRNFSWTSVADGKKYNSKFALLGMAATFNNHPVFADGVNETGLCCATLYFPDYAHYEKEINPRKENLAPYDFVYWALSNFSDINALENSLKDISFKDSPLNILGITPPLHWILSDRTGRTIVIENTTKGLSVTENPIGVMTNSPDINWHLTNLRQYIGLNPNQDKPISWNGLDLSAFGQASGTFALPGDFTPPSRFVRAAYLKNTIIGLEDELSGINAIFTILANCQVPKGAVLKEDGALDYTLYASAMCSESCIYYYKTYDNNQVIAINLLNEDLNAKDLKVFPLNKKANIKFLN